MGVAIAEGDAAVAFEPLYGFFMRFIIALAMGDGDVDRLMQGVSPRKGRVVALDAQMLSLADEPQIAVAHQHARQQAALAQNLAAVANA